MQHTQRSTDLANMKRSRTGYLPATMGFNHCMQRHGIVGVGCRWLRFSGRSDDWMMLLIALMLVTLERMGGRVDKWYWYGSPRSGMSVAFLSFFAETSSLLYLSFSSGTLYGAGTVVWHGCSRVYRFRGRSSDAFGVL